MARDVLDTAIQRLYGVPLEAFVAERTRAARELRSAGERSAADELAKLPKPSAAAWALNHVAREDARAVEEWLEATAALRDAWTRSSVLGGDALRASMDAQRTATAVLIDVIRDRARPGGRRLSEAMVERVRTLLQSATADAQLAERLRAGCVVEEQAATELAFGIASGVGSEAKPAATRPRAQGPDRDARRAARSAELDRLVTSAQAEVQRLREEVARLEAVAEAADGRLEEARRSLHRSQSEADAARDAVGDAEKAATLAERKLERLRRRAPEGHEP